MADHEDDDLPLLDMDKEGGDAVPDAKVEEHLDTAPGMNNRKVWLVKVSTNEYIESLRVYADRSSRAGPQVSAGAVGGADPGRRPPRDHEGLQHVGTAQTSSWHATSLEIYPLTPSCTLHSNSQSSWKHKEPDLPPPARERNLPDSRPAQRV